MYCGRIVSLLFQNCVKPADAPKKFLDLVAEYIVNHFDNYVQQLHKVRTNEYQQIKLK